tara:strand:- start:17 stop:739 length:723 start_codon:yes stop_codon:yes gene_type:complete
MDLDEITSQNTYTLKESSVLEYNEAQTTLAQAITLKYYIENTHRLSQKASDEDALLCIQVHRNSSGPAHLDLIESIFSKLLSNLDLVKIPNKGKCRTYYSPSNKCQIHLRYGTTQMTMRGYDGVDLLLSLSLAAGLDSKLKSSSILIPSRFIPFDLNSQVLAKSAEFDVRNHLSEVVDEILSLQTSELIDRTNTLFTSPNPQKKHLNAEMIKKEDIQSPLLLQASGSFYPKKMHPDIALI